MIKNSSLLSHHFALYELDSAGRDITNRFNAKAFSRFKYGSGLDALHFGQELADSFFQKYQNWIEIDTCITCSAYKKVHNAAYAMMSHFSGKLNYLLSLRKQVPLQYVHIMRGPLLEGDYGKLSLEERKVVMDQNEIYLNNTIVNNKRVLVLDDVRITGLHEIKIHQLLQSAGVREAIFIYIVSAGNVQPELEHILNHAAIQTLDDFLQLMQIDGFTLNSRCCKFLLSTDSESLPTFIDQLSDIQLANIFWAFCQDGYSLMPLYNINFRIFEISMHDRGLINRSKL